ncbi:unnamed protein product [Euphydryas editha]|uniref:Uncharacterized protein n=1 Tax=Euphydryas editha TaxID=104508 RepID=A0AAU9UL68_EUPED|nr:unnamed protein product [Euphydryas editha]
MFLRKYAKTNLLNRFLVSENNCQNVQQIKTLCGTLRVYNKNLNLSFSKCNRFVKLLPHTSYSVRYFSKKVIEDAFKESESEKELSRIKEIFTQPRVILNQFASKTPEKIFDIHYKQAVVAPKGGKKKNIQNDWVCTYTFIWPEKIKFESAAISKGKAADKAATQALYWLYKNKRIDERGCPVYDRSVLKDLQSTLNKNIHVTISENSMERINKIWSDYESEIKSKYEDTFKEAKQKLLNTASAFNKDSTIDDQDQQPPIHPVFGKVMIPTQSALERRERTLEQTFRHYDEKLTPLPIDGYV